MEDYITVVAVDEEISNGSNSGRPQKPVDASPPEDSSFITVLSINDAPGRENSAKTQANIEKMSEKNDEEEEEDIESVVVYRLPGERLGFGLKFQGGTKTDEQVSCQTTNDTDMPKSNEKVQRLFIQSCAKDSPASRAKATWGHLKEGDEIISIDGKSVADMTRIECVRCLKDSNVAIKLQVRNRDGLPIDEFEDEIYKRPANHQPPPPPPVPPRKLIKRRQGNSSPKEDHPFTPPPDAEYYINLFANENSVLGECESDDTGSSISTVVDRFSICSTYSTDSDYSNGGVNSTTITNSSQQVINKTDLAKVLKPFTLLEKEFNVDSSAKLEECLKKLDPVVNISPRGSPKQSVKTYENVEVSANPKSELNCDPAYENVEISKPDAPKPKPRQIPTVEPKKRSIMPIPRKSNKEAPDSSHTANAEATKEKKRIASPSKSQDVISRIPKISPPRLLRRAKTEGEIKLVSKKPAMELIGIDVKESCRQFLQFESGRSSLPMGVTEVEVKSKSKIPVARLERKRTDDDKNVDTVDCSASKLSEKSMILKPRILFRKQKSETDLKFSSQNIKLKEPNRNETSRIHVTSPPREFPPSRIAVRSPPPPPPDKTNLNLNISANSPGPKSSGESKINFSISPMVPQQPNTFDDVSVMTPIRTKSHIPVLSPDANECSFKTFSKDTDKRHIILNIAPDKDRKILNVNTALPVPRGNPVPSPVVPNLNSESKSLTKEQPTTLKKAVPSSSDIRFTIQTYEGDKLDTDPATNDLNRPSSNRQSPTKIPQKIQQPNVDENGNERKPLPRLIDMVPKNDDNNVTNITLDSNGESVIHQDTDSFDEDDQIIIRKCIKLTNDDESNYVMSSSSSDEEEEKIYEIEDGEKLGPPELIGGPGPSEAYFNFSWHSNMLPTIGEVEEEFSSLETPSRPSHSIAKNNVTQNFNDDTAVIIAIDADESAIKEDINTAKKQPVQETLKKDTPTPISDSAAITTACTTNEHSNDMMVSLKCVDEENKLAANVDKITQTAEINEISNNLPQSTLLVVEKVSTESSSSAENRSDGDGTAADDTVNMSKINETNETSENATELVDLSPESEDPPEIVAPTVVKVTSETFENVVPPPVEDSTSTTSTSMEFAQAEVVTTVKVDSKPEEDNNNNNTIKNTVDVKDKPSSNTDIEIVEEIILEEPKTDTTWEEPIVEKVIEIVEMTDVEEPVTTTVTIVDDDTDPTESQPADAAIAIDSESTQTERSSGDNQSSDMNLPDPVSLLSNKEAIAMTQAILNAERAVSMQGPSVSLGAKVELADNATDSLIDLTEENTQETPVEENESLKTMETDTKPVVTVDTTVLDAEALNFENPIVSPVINDPVQMNREESASLEVDTNVKIKSDTTQIPEEEKEVNEVMVADQVKVESNLDTLQNVSHPIDEPTLTTSSDSEGSTKQTSSIRELDETQSKPIERIILGVENNRNSLVDTPKRVVSTPASSNDAQLKQPTVSEQADQQLKPELTPAAPLDTKSKKPVPLPKPSNLLGCTKDSNLKMDKSGIQLAPAPLILNDYISLSSPPTYSRLPPDGHEFPPNFSEPMIIPVKTAQALTTDTKVTNKQSSILDRSKNNNNTDCPPLPKSVPPPTVPRKVFRQDLVIKVDDARTPDKIEKVFRLDQPSSLTSSPLVPSAFESSRIKSSSINTLHSMDSYKTRPSPVARKISDWRKDEKSEKSVRDKIAMFSNDDRPDINKTSGKTFNKSIENLLDSSSKYQPFTSSLTKKAMSVENLNDDYRPYSRTHSGYVERNTPESTLYKSEITQSYSSLPRRNIPTLTRTTSFSGHDEGSRKASIANLLEHRRKSMSKLRGLVIPERPCSNLETIIDLPEIKSKDSEKIKMNGYSSLQTPKKDRYSQSYRSPVASPSPSLTNGVYKGIFSSGNRLSASTPSTPITAAFKKPDGITLPPAKPPRTSLILSKASHIEESDSDSVFSSKISSPPMSPRAPVQEKFALTRTLSSETNTSIASSTTSTLTSGSGSQASCSSVGSTPTVDMSRKILKSGSGDSTVNRKNILASAKCRSGRDDSSSLARNRRYEDEDSTDGYDEEEIRRAPKLKQRSLSSGSNKSNATPAPINYKLITKDQSIVDKIVNVAAYVEITSDTDDSSRKSDSSLRKISAIFIDEERKASFKADPNQKAKAKKPEPAKRSTASESDDLAKWVQSEAAKAFKQKDTSMAKPAVAERTALADKFESLHKSPLDISPRTPIKLKTSTAEIREKFELRTQTSQSSTKSSPISNKLEKPSTIGTYHERFSSLDSIASSSSGVSSSTQNLPSNQETPTEFGSFSSLGSNQSLITAQDVQVLIEEADPPLKTPDAFIVVLQRETPESSIGITLAGGSDYEAKEITIHKILGNTPAAKDGRLRKGDRILAINGLSMRGLTHRESITVLKTPRPEVVLVVTRSESVIVKSLSKKRSSLGSLTSLNDKPNQIDLDKKMSYHKASRSLDLDLDIVSSEHTNEMKSSKLALEKATTTNGSVSPSEMTSQQHNSHRQSSPLTRGGGGGGIKINTSEILDRVRETGRLLTSERQDRIVINGDELPSGAREIEIVKDNCGLGFSIEGGYDSPVGDRPLVVKKVFWGGAAQRAGNIQSGDEILCISGVSTTRMSRVDVWNYMKQLPMGPVKIILL